jgi:hypothetical protein
LRDHIRAKEAKLKKINDQIDTLTEKGMKEAVELAAATDLYTAIRFRQEQRATTQRQINQISAQQKALDLEKKRMRAAMLSGQMAPAIGYNAEPRRGRPLDLPVAQPAPRHMYRLNNAPRNNARIEYVDDEPEEADEEDEDGGEEESVEDFDARMRGLYLGN